MKLRNWRWWAAGLLLVVCIVCILELVDEPTTSPVSVSVVLHE